MGLKFIGGFKPATGVMKISTSEPPYAGWDIELITLNTHNAPLATSSQVLLDTANSLWMDNITLNTYSAPLATSSQVLLDTANGDWMDSITLTTQNAPLATSSQVLLDTANGPWMLFDNSLGN